MKKILVIEDENDIRENIMDLLNEEGYIAIGAQDGEEGIHRIWQEFPDLVVCDILMPKVDGYGVLTVMSKSPITATIPFIFLTAKTQNRDLRKGMVLGADDYITKPFTRIELLQAIETRLLKHDQLRAQAQQKLSEMRNNISFSMPHELLTLLSVILGFSEFLIHDLKPVDENIRTLEIINDIHAAGQRLLRSLQKYLLFAELEMILTDAEKINQARHARVTISQANLLNVIEALGDIQQRQKDFRFEVDNARICVSEAYLQRLLEELLDNAIKFSPAGKPILVTGHAQREKGIYSIVIQDEGKGMTPEQVAGLSRLFQKEKKIYERQGTGLGLEIVRQIVDIHQGMLNIQSKPGEWTKIEVLFQLG